MSIFNREKHVPTENERPLEQVSTWERPPLELEALERRMYIPGAAVIPSAEGIALYEGLESHGYSTLPDIIDELHRANVEAAAARSVGNTALLEE